MTLPDASSWTLTIKILELLLAIVQTRTIQMYLRISRLDKVKTRNKRHTDAIPLKRAVVIARKTIQVNISPLILAVIILERGT